MAVFLVVSLRNTDGPGNQGATSPARSPGPSSVSKASRAACFRARRACIASAPK
jgi:hypothetical protein